MFNAYELRLIDEALADQLRSEVNRRRQQGISEEVIEAQLGGLLSLIAKVCKERKGQA
jgi:hypothetical protein